MWFGPSVAVVELPSNCSRRTSIVESVRFIIGRLAHLQDNRIESVASVGINVVASARYDLWRNLIFFFKYSVHTAGERFTNKIKRVNFSCIQFSYF